MPDIFCDQLSDETKAEMEKLIRYTEETGNEHGMKLCRIDDKIVNSKRCTGDKCSIPSKAFRYLFCPENSEYVSEFHTHPVEKGEKPDIYETPSESDIVRSSELYHSHTCVSSGKDNTYCYKIPKDNIDLATEMWQKITDLDYMKELLDAKVDEDADIEEINLISEDMNTKKVEFNRALNDLEYTSAKYSLSPNLIKDRCKVKL